MDQGYYMGSIYINGEKVDVKSFEAYKGERGFNYTNSRIDNGCRKTTPS